MERQDTELDARLGDLEPLRRLVHELPNDELSMAWRADLNERLRAVAPLPKRRSWGWVWKPAAGLGLASILAVTMLMKSPQVATPLAQGDSGIAQAMLEAHQQTVAQKELGTVPIETLNSDSASAPADWNEVDLTTL